MTWILGGAIALVVLIAARRRARRHELARPVLTRAQLVRRGFTDDLERNR